MTVTLLAGAATFGLTLLASAISHARGGSPFAFTRLSKVVVYRRSRPSASGSYGNRRFP
ncbi:MAG: hypothetical protein V5A34_08810 [Halapricum sp.]